MYKYQVCLDTITQIRKFVRIAEGLPFDIRIENSNGTKRGNAKTLLNVLGVITYDKIYILSDQDMYTAFQEFIIN